MRQANFAEARWDTDRDVPAWVVDIDLHTPSGFGMETVDAAPTCNRRRIGAPPATIVRETLAWEGIEIRK